MYEIYFYRDKNGKELVKEYMAERAGESYIKHLGGDIWELRPLRDRILFAAWDGNGFVLLHVFMKQTKKTPQREIERAERSLSDHRERRVHDEKK